jgi:hypothetical protein
VRRRGEGGEPELSEAEQERLVELLSDEHPEQGR